MGSRTPKSALPRRQSAVSLTQRFSFLYTIHTNHIRLVFLVCFKIIVNVRVCGIYRFLYCTTAYVTMFFHFVFLFELGERFELSVLGFPPYSALQERCNQPDYANLALRAFGDLLSATQRARTYVTSPTYPLRGRYWIRTNDGVTHTRLAGEHLRPLGQSSILQLLITIRLICNFAFIASPTSLLIKS